jgi:DNA-binding response OmpR family regulator
MRVGILGGTAEDEAHLTRITGRLANAFQLFRLDEPPLGRRESALPGAPAQPASPGRASKLEALVFHALDRLDLALHALRAVREDPFFDAVSAVIALRADSPAASELPAGFDDFILYPYASEELALRISALQRRRTNLARDPILAALGLTIDHAGRDVFLDGRRVQLTAREFALLSHFAQWQGRVLSREHLLARVWGSKYSGGRRTVDIHVRRLRAKFGARFPLETLRGSGYRLRPELPLVEAALPEPETLSKAS